MEYLPEALHNHDLIHYFCPNLTLRQNNFTEKLQKENARRRKTELRSNNDKFLALCRLASVLFDEPPSFRVFNVFRKNNAFSFHLPTRDDLFFSFQFLFQGEFSLLSFLTDQSNILFCLCLVFEYLPLFLLLC